MMETPVRFTPRSSVQNRSHRQCRWKRVEIWKLQGKQLWFFSHDSQMTKLFMWGDKWIRKPVWSRWQITEGHLQISTDQPSNNVLFRQRCQPRSSVSAKRGNDWHWTIGHFKLAGSDKANSVVHFDNCKHLIPETIFCSALRVLGG